MELARELASLSRRISGPFCAKCDAADPKPESVRAGTGAFAIVAGAVTPLPGTPGSTLAISNGSRLYVARSAGETSKPVRWSINWRHGEPAHDLALLAGEGVGAGLGVNDAGDAVGG